MKVALEISPITGKSNVRGIGTYTQNLKKSLEGLKSNLELVTFSGGCIPQADVVHYPYFDLYFHTLPLLRSKPRIVTIHDVIPLVFKGRYPVGSRGKLAFFLQKKALKKTDAVICDSETSKKDIYENLGYPRDKIHVVYLAPSEEFKELKKETSEKVRSKYELPKDFFLYVGDVNWNKNIIGLLDAVKKTNINLVMVGKALLDGSLPQVQEIESVIQKHGIGSQISKVGYLPSNDLCATYNLADATVVPSFYEGFGLPILESMASGTPVLCSNNSSLVEVGGRAAIYFDAKDPENIATEIERFLAIGSSKLKAVKQKCLSHAKKFTWEKVAEETIEVYKMAKKA